MEIQTIDYQGLTFEKVWLMFQESKERFEETRRTMHEQNEETRKIMHEQNEETRKFMQVQNQEASRMIKELSTNISGISDSNGAMAEDFFFTALENKMQVGKLKFDYLDRNLKRKRKNTEAQYDMIMYNAYKVLIIEVKYNFTEKQLREFYEKRLKKFRVLFPQYADYKLYGCIAGLVIDDKVKQIAEDYGFMVLTQNNQAIKILNDKHFVPSEIH